MPGSAPNGPLALALQRQSKRKPVDAGERDAPTYRCHGCHDTGWLRRRIGPEDWRTEVVRCVCRQDEAKRQAWERARRASDLSSHLYSRTFDNFASVPAVADAAYDVARWADQPEGWIVLQGTPGIGKTHLLAAAFNALVANGHCPLYVLTPNLLDYMREGYAGGDYGDRFWSIRKTPILLLDDLGAELRTAWSDQALFMLLDHRYANRLPTLVATNAALAALEPRISSRLQDVALAHVHILSGPDYRRIRRTTTDSVH